jgi:uncharacterized FAD-dependent dehydrogenase
MGVLFTRTDFDVAIVGAGAAGLLAAYEISEKSALKIVIIEEGNDVHKRDCPAREFTICMKCKPCNILCGVGGAGTFSSGLLNLNPYIGGDLTEFTENESEAWELVNRVDQVFKQNGAPNQIYAPDKESTTDLSRKAASAGLRFIPTTQRLIGTDNAPTVITNIKKTLQERGVEFKLKSKVIEINDSTLTLKQGDKISAHYTLLAPGRWGMEWVAQQMEKLKVKTRFEPLDIGIRVEVPATIMDPICTIQRDPKFHIYTHTYDDFTRTFCVNHEGYVVQEVYEDHVCVNGHSSLSNKSEATNFAFLVRMILTQPFEDTTAYGRSIGKQTTLLGGGKPLLQRLGDLRAGRRSTWERITRSAVRPTLRDVTPGDIAMAMPHRIVTDIIEGLEKLDKLIPGVASDPTLLYAPEIKYSAKRVLTNKGLETEIPNLFVAGDGVGVSRGIVSAAATGLVVARSILKKENHA